MASADLFSMLDIDPGCERHAGFPMRVQHNKAKRLVNISKSYALKRTDKEGTECLVQLPANVKGSWLYASKIARRLNSMSTPKGLSTILTLTYPSRDGCVYCAYQSITARWRTLRQNWQNYRLPAYTGYLGVVEPHKDGFPHLHFVMWLTRRFTRSELSNFHTIWGARVDVQHAKKPVGYVFKYLTKGLKDLTFISMLSELRVRQYFCSKGMLPKLPPPSSDYLFLGETGYDLNLIKEWFLWSPLEGSPVPTGYLPVARTRDLILYAKF